MEDPETWRVRDLVINKSQNQKTTKTSEILISPDDPMARSPESPGLIPFVSQSSSLASNYLRSGPLGMGFPGWKVGKPMLYSTKLSASG